VELEGPVLDNDWWACLLLAVLGEDDNPAGVPGTVPVDTKFLSSEAMDVDCATATVIFARLGLLGRFIISTGAPNIVRDSISIL